LCKLAFLVIECNYIEPSETFKERYGYKYWHHKMAEQQPT